MTDDIGLDGLDNGRYELDSQKSGFDFEKLIFQKFYDNRFRLLRSFSNFVSYDEIEQRVQRVFCSAPPIGANVRGTVGLRYEWKNKGEGTFSGYAETGISDKKGNSANVRIEVENGTRSVAIDATRENDIVREKKK